MLGGKNLFIKPEIKQISINGKVLISDGNRRIILKKPLLEAFPELQTRQLLNYKMELYFEKDVLMEKIKDSLNQGVLPVLLFFEKNNSEK